MTSKGGDQRPQKLVIMDQDGLRKYIAERERVVAGCRQKTVLVTEIDQRKRWKILEYLPDKRKMDDELE